MTARTILAGLLAAFAAGCDVDGFVSEPPSSRCERVGAQCRLAAGPLGVCESAPCPPGQAPPCLVCTSQH